VAGGLGDDVQEDGPQVRQAEPELLDVDSECWTRPRQVQPVGSTGRRSAAGEFIGPVA
jgi:hypothetical protein